jgi:hypothetical protein
MIKWICVITATIPAENTMLISTRRFLAVLLVPIFLVVFLGTMLAFRINATVLESDFYTDALNDLDVYNFVYDEGLPYAIRRAELDGDFTLDSIPLGIELTPQTVSARVAQVLPPQWLEDKVSAVVNAGVPYITGESERIAITVTVDDRVEAASEVFKDLLLEADVHSFLVDDFIQKQLDEALLELPYGLALTNEDIANGIIEVVPQDWFKEQVAGVLDETTPYLVGEQDSFSVTIPLNDRAASAINVAEGWFLTSLDGGAYDYLLEEQIAPVVQSALGAVVELPYGVTVSNEEIVDALAAVIPPQWVAERVSDALDAIGPYLIGETDSFLLTIPLEDRAELAAPTLVAAVNTKFELIYTSLRVCSAEEIAAVVSSLSLDTLPACRPPIVTYAQLKRVVGLDVLEELVQAFVQPLPDEITVNEQVLFAALGDNASYLDTTRQVLHEGYTFTDQDLLAVIRDQSSSPAEAADNVALFQDIRRYLRDGFTFTSADIEEAVGAADLATLDDVRGYIAQGRGLLLLLVIVPALIVVIIGFLGGRRWGTRLAWAGVPIVFAGVITTVAFGPVASRGFEVIDEVIRNLEINEIFIMKLLDARAVMQANFVSPLAAQSMAIAAVGFAMTVIGLYAMGRPRTS